MEHIYFIGYRGIDGKLNTSETTHTLEEAKLRRFHLQAKNKPLEYVVVEGTILPNDEPVADLGKF
jgi:hypothetical protein